MRRTKLRTKPRDQKKRKLIFAIMMFRFKELGKYPIADPRAIRLIAKDLYRESQGLVSFDEDGNASFDLPLGPASNISPDDFENFLKRWKSTIVKVLEGDIDYSTRPSIPLKLGVSKEHALEFAQKHILDSINISLSEQPPDGLDLRSEWGACWWISYANSTDGSLLGSDLLIGLSKKTGKIVYQGRVGG